MRRMQVPETNVNEAATRSCQSVPLCLGAHSGTSIFVGQPPNGGYPRRMLWVPTCERLE
jgi:hypothetical protein